ncbi:hypothetical protein NEFER03_2080 [Nematocida sp. LUAm3]|nr:hypothetical protein NEFER03_2080 [Nematocida sp. LUAm3]KAI5176202.1 hypothetical protein NEFER02_2008 [Nematocida sp. LUAm2]KAI5179190.1 hypothetical protein NEFER01_2047 [Nematocida sp. LUAm1]
MINWKGLLYLVIFLVRDEAFSEEEGNWVGDREWMYIRLLREEVPWIMAYNGAMRGGLYSDIMGICRNAFLDEEEKRKKLEKRLEEKKYLFGLVVGERESRGMLANDILEFFRGEKIDQEKFVLEFFLNFLLPKSCHGRAEDIYIPALLDVLEEEWALEAEEISIKKAEEYFDIIFLSIILSFGEENKTGFVDQSYTRRVFVNTLLPWIKKYQKKLQNNNNITLLLEVENIFRDILIEKKKDDCSLEQSILMVLERNKCSTYLRGSIINVDAFISRLVIFYFSGSALTDEESKMHAFEQFLLDVHPLGNIFPEIREDAVEPRSKIYIQALGIEESENAKKEKKLCCNKSMALSRMVFHINVVVDDLGYDLEEKYSLKKLQDLYASKNIKIFLYDGLSKKDFVYLEKMILLLRSVIGSPDGKFIFETSAWINHIEHASSLNSTREFLRNFQQKNFVRMSIYPSLREYDVRSRISSFFSHLKDALKKLFVFFLFALFSIGSALTLLDSSHSSVVFFVFVFFTILFNLIISFITSKSFVYMKMINGISLLFVFALFSLSTCMLYNDTISEFPSDSFVFYTLTLLLGLELFLLLLSLLCMLKRRAITKCSKLLIRRISVFVYTLCICSAVFLIFFLLFFFSNEKVVKICSSGILIFSSVLLCCAGLFDAFDHRSISYSCISSKKLIFPKQSLRILSLFFLLLSFLLFVWVSNEPQISGVLHGLNEYIPQEQPPLLENVKESPTQIDIEDTKETPLPLNTSPKSSQSSFLFLIEYFTGKKK